MIEAFRFGDAVTVNCAQNTTLSDPSVRVIRLIGTLAAERSLAVPVRAGADYDVVVDTVAYGVNFGPGVHLAVGDRARVVHDGVGWKAVTLSATQTLDIDAMSVKTTPVADDLIIIGDSEDSNLPKRTTISQIKDELSTLGGEVTGPIENTVVSEIRGYGFSADTPGAGDALIISGGEWAPATVVLQSEYDSEVPGALADITALTSGLVGTTLPTTFTTTHTTAHAKWLVGGIAYAGEVIPTEAREFAVSTTHPELLKESVGGASALTLNSASDWELYPLSDSWKTILIGTWKAYRAWNGGWIYKHLIDDWRPYLQQDQGLSLHQNNIKRLSYMDQYISGGAYRCRYAIEGIDFPLMTNGIAFVVGGYVVHGTLSAVAHPIYYEGTGDLLDPLVVKTTGIGANTSQTILEGQYFCTHVFAHQSGRISVNGTMQSFAIKDIVYGIHADMRAVHAYCNNSPTTASATSGVLTTNMIPLGSLIYKFESGAPVLQEFDGVEIWPYEPPIAKTLPARYDYSNTDPVGGVAHSAGKLTIQISIGGVVTAYDIDTCQHTAGITGNRGGAIRANGAFAAAGIKTANDYLRLFVPKPPNADSHVYFKFSFDAHKRSGASHSHYSAVYDFAASSTETDISLLSSVGTTPFQAVGAAASGDYYVITLITLNTLTDLDVEGIFDMAEWRIYST